MSPSRSPVPWSPWRTSLSPGQVHGTAATARLDLMHRASPFTPWPLRPGCTQPHAPATMCMRRSTPHGSHAAPHPEFPSPGPHRASKLVSPVLALLPSQIRAGRGSEGFQGAGPTSVFKSTMSLSFCPNHPAQSSPETGPTAQHLPRYRRAARCPVPSLRAHTWGPYPSAPSPFPHGTQLAECDRWPPHHFLHGLPLWPLCCR